MVDWQSGESVWSSYNPFNLRSVPAYTYSRKPSKSFVYKPKGSIFGKTDYIILSPEKKKMPPVKRKLTYSSPSPRKSRGRMTIGQISAAKRRAIAKFLVKKAEAAKKRRRGAATSISAGFTKTNSKVIRSDMSVSNVQEAGGLLTDKKACYVGHTTCPNNTIVIFAFAAVIKKLIIKSGNDVNDLDQTIFGDIYEDGTLAGSFFTLNYRLGSVVTDPLASINFLLSANNTVYTIANAMRIWAQDKGTQLNFISMEFTIGNGVANIRTYKVQLMQTHVAFMVKSSLKIQNRSSSASGGDEADDVDNTPLYGKSYEGSGSGCDYVGDNIKGTTIHASLYGNENNGEFTRVTGFPVVTGGNTSLVEPPPGSHFFGVKKCGKIHLDPGHLKTSVLTWRKSYEFNKMILLYNNDTSHRFYRRFSEGKYRFFGLEKILETVNGADPTDLRVAYEVNYSLTAVVTREGQQHTTVTKYGLP